MNTLISALGLIVSWLMESLSQTEQSEDQKKSEVAKSLAEFVFDIDNIVANGYEILSKLQTLTDHPAFFTAQLTLEEVRGNLFVSEMRTLLNKTFSEEALLYFCYDNYPSVYEQLSSETTFQQIIDKLIESDRTEWSKINYEFAVDHWSSFIILKMLNYTPQLASRYDLYSSWKEVKSSYISKQVPTSQTELEFNLIAEELVKLIYKQSERLERMAVKLYRINDDLTSYNPFSRGRAVENISQNTIDVHKVLSVYEPDFGNSVRSILFRKKNILRHVGEFLLHSLKGKDAGRLVIREVADLSNLRSFAHASTFHPGKFVFSSMGRDINSLYDSVEFQEFDLAYPEEREKYIRKAKQRLGELKIGRDKLADLIQKYYEPHHLI